MSWAKRRMVIRGLCLVLLLTTVPRPVLGASPRAVKPVFVSPANGQVLPLASSLSFRVTPLSGASGYLWSFVQHGVIVWENLTFDGRLSPSVYTIPDGSRAHRRLQPGVLQVLVRAQLGLGQWSAAASLTVDLQARPSPAPTPGFPAGKLLFAADASGGLDKLALAPGWKHLNGLLLNDGTTGSSIVIPYDLGHIVDYAVDAQIQYGGSGCGNYGASFGVYARGNLSIGRYYGGVQGCGSVHIWGDNAGDLGKADFALDGGWHDYRLEIRGSNIRLLVDGEPIVFTTDARLVADQGGQVGLFTSGGPQFSVRRVALYALSPLPQSAPHPGTIVFQADASNGLRNLISAPGWKHVNDELVDDGTTGSSVVIPYDLGSIVNYAVEAQIQYSGSGCGNYGASFGVYARANLSIGRYYGGVQGCGSVHIWGDNAGDLGSADFALDTGWHDYRLEIRGNRILLRIDGRPVVSATDNRLVTDQGGQVGLFTSGGPQFSVRRVTLTVL